jgi:hypothetical protein
MRLSVITSAIALLGASAGGFPSPPSRAESAAANPATTLSPATATGRSGSTLASVPAPKPDAGSAVGAAADAQRPPTTVHAEDRSATCQHERRRISAYLDARRNALACTRDEDCSARIAVDLCNTDCQVFANPNTVAFQEMKRQQAAREAACTDGLCGTRYFDCAERLSHPRARCRSNKCVTIGHEAHPECGSPSPAEFRIWDTTSIVPKAAGQGVDRSRP